MNEITQQMLALAAKGNQYAIEDLYRLTYNSVYKTVKVLIQDEDTVLDIVQDTYIKAFQSLGQLDRPENFRAWIKRIASNKAKDHLKKKKPILFSEMANEEGDEIDFLDERLEDYPELVMDRKETARLMKQILDSLSEDQRLVIGMFYYEQMSVKEIAESLGCSENTVKSRLNYGRKKVEVQVKELEKRGTKLYSLAPLPFLLSLFAMDASAAEIPSAAVLEGITAKCAAGSAASAGTAGVGAKAAAHAGAKAATGAGAKALTTKIIAGVLAVTVAGGGTMLARSSNDQDEVEPTHQIVSTEITAAEPTQPLETTLPDATETAVPETIAASVHAVPAEEAYQEIASAYQSVIDIDSTAFLSNPESYFNGDHVAVCYHHMYHGGNFYYAYSDIDGNGMEEMLIGYGSDGYISIVDLYTFNAGHPVQLIDEITLGDRSRLTLMEDGSLYLYGSGGAAAGSHTLWRINSRGSALDTVFAYYFDFIEGYDGIYHGSDGSTITDTQFNQMMESYHAVTDIPWRLLGDTENESPVFFDSILTDIQTALAVSTQDYDSNMEYYDTLYAHFGPAAMWELMHRQSGDYTMCIWYAYQDMDGDGRDDLLIGRGLSPSNLYPIRIFKDNGDVIFGDAIYAYTEPLYGGSVPTQWEYLGG